MSFQGLLLGLVCFLCIGAFHPIVVYAEYYFSKKIVWLFFLIGLFACIATFFFLPFLSPEVWPSSASPAFGVSMNYTNRKREWKEAGFRKIQRENFRIIKRL